VLATVTFSGETASGWQTAKLGTPVPLQSGRWYVVSYHAPAGRYADDVDYFAEHTLTSGVLEARAGLYAYGQQARYPSSTWRHSTYYADVLFVPRIDTGTIGPIQPTPSPTTVSPSPTRSTAPSTSAPAPTTTAATPTATGSTKPAPTGAFPDASNTGVPDGRTLSRYSGTCEIRSSVTLDSVDASGCSAILVRAPNVVIRNSLLPRVDATAGGSASVTVSDSTVRAGSWSDGAVWGYNITATRLDVTGGQHSVHCVTFGYASQTTMNPLKANATAPVAAAAGRRFRRRRKR